MAYEWLTQGLQTTWDEIVRLVRPLPEADLDRLTPCPGWSVRDVVSHLIGFELMLAGTPLPEFEGDMPEYVKNDIGKFNEAFVQTRRSYGRDELLDEFQEVSRQSIERLAAMSDEAWEAQSWSPEGEVPYHRFMETRILDSWIHLQDLRDALAQPLDDHGIGEEIVVNRFEAALPYVIGKRAGAPEGTRVRFNLIGRVGRSTDVVVTDGRAKASSEPGEPNLEITTPVALFWRRAAGRISAGSFLEASETHVLGDPELARRIADGLVVMI